MDNFDLRKYLAEGRLLKEDVSKDPSFVRTKEGLKQIFQQMLSGELSGKEANDQISDFTFGQGSMGIYPDTNSLFLRQFGMGGGDFNDYIIGKFENGGFTPATQPKSKTALKIWNYLSNLKLAEGKLFEEVNTEEEIKTILSKSYPGAYSEEDFEEIINLYNTKYKDYRDSYGNLDGVEQSAFKFNYVNNRDIMTGMKAGSKSSTSIGFPEMEDEFEGAMSSMSISKEEYLQDIIDASADEIVSDSYFEIKNAVEQGIYSKDEAVKLAKEWARIKLK
jgi:hypothetical protein